MKKEIINNKNILNEIINSINNLIFYVDENYIIEFINENGNYNINPEDYIGKNIIDIIQMDDRTKFKNYIENFGSNNFPEIEIKFILPCYKSGKSFSLIISKLKNTSNINSGYLIQAKNIEDLIKFQEEYYKKSELVKECLNVSTVFFLVIDYYHQISLINDTGCKLLNLPKEKLLGQNWLENFIIEEDRNLFQKNIDEIYNNDSDNAVFFEASILTNEKKANLISWSVKLLKDKPGHKIGFVCTGIDITEKKTTEKELLENKHLLNAVINTIPFEFWFENNNGNIIIQNPVSKKKWGNQIGNDISEISNADGFKEFRNANLELLKKGNIIKKDFENKYGHFQLTNAPVIFDEKTYGTIGIAIDITKTKKNEKKLRSLVEHTVHSLGRAAEVFDRETGDHTQRIGNYCSLFAGLLNKSKDFQDTIQIHSQLHDVGKIHIPSEILNKKGKLTDEEFNIIKKHTVFGGLIIGKDLDFIIARNIALYHHEKWDGSGYPDGLIGEEIPFEARVATIADVFDALISKRVYKDALNYNETYNIFINGDNRLKPRSSFDPAMLKIFLDNYEKFIEIHKQSLESEESKNFFKMDVIFLDDDPSILKLIDKYFSKYFPNIQLHIYNSVKKTLKNISEEKYYPHLCFIDVNLPDGSGHDVAKDLRKKYPYSQLVCITGSRSVQNIYLYDRVFHKPIDLNKIKELTQVIWDYYFFHN